MKMNAWLITLIVLLLIVMAVLALLSHPAFPAPFSEERKARIEASPNYKDGMFKNEIPTPQFTGKQSMVSTLWSFMTDRGSDGLEPSEPLVVEKTDLTTLQRDTDCVVWFGHSSYFLQLGGKRFLVDPVLNLEFPVTLILHAFKGTDVYSPADIPPIDYLILTHEHWDHLDYATLRDIRERVGRVVCPLGVGQYVERWGYEKDSISEMDWYETTCLEGVNVVCWPTRHFSNRLFGRNKTLWASFLLQVGNRQVYIGGDGGYDDRFKRLREKYGQVDLAIMENGQYNENWANIHLLPKDLERAVLDIDAKSILTVHHDKFALAHHAWNEPDSVAHDIALKHHQKVLDSTIGSVIRY